MTITTEQAIEWLDDIVLHDRVVNDGALTENGVIAKSIRAQLLAGAECAKALEAITYADQAGKRYTAVHGDTEVSVVQEATTAYKRATGEEK